MPKTILLPVDLSDPQTSGKALAAALELVGPKTTLHVVSVLPKFGYTQVAGYFSADFEKKALKRFGQELTKWVNANVPEDVDVKPHVLHGSIYHEVLTAAKKLKADLIVIGAHRPELKDYFLGPNAARIVQHAKQSVYVVRN
ncbi:MAG: universal stress protein [Burkholderiaceae bacterium]|nr:universal stress protein [Burkholderiaceae bacterium]MCD8536255.1 universal stress protein [Burkholderiaceae bacterium]